MTTDEYEACDGLALAEHVRRGETTPAQLLAAALERIAQRNPALNAVVTPLEDAAHRAIAAGLPEGAFTGVPFLVKELVAAVAGTATTGASRLNTSPLAAADSEIVARFRRAGLVIAGKTNSSEFGLSPATESRLYGITHNPWQLDRSPGGSSGGSAAAVAAGLVPIAHATDGGGSIRIPASCCGLFGLKPTRGRITAGPAAGEGLSGLAGQHVISRSVRDSAAMLDATAGCLPGDPYAARPPLRPYLEEVAAEPGRLRLAFSTTAPTGAPVDAACVAAVLDAARLCEALGHHVEEAAPEYDAFAFERGFATIFAAHTMANVARVTGGGLPEATLLEPLTRALAKRGAGIAAADFILALQTLQYQSRRVAAFFEHHDVWLTPTLTQPPLPLGYFDIDSGDVDAWLARVTCFIAFTYPFNITGQPAASVPLHWSADGLPIGCQFAVRYGEEALLFRLCGQLERARPWFDRRPPVVNGRADV